MKLRSCQIIHRVYEEERSFIVTIKVIEAGTGEIVEDFKRTYQGIPRSLIYDYTRGIAYEIARELGFEEVATYDVENMEVI